MTNRVRLLLFCMLAATPVLDAIPQEHHDHGSHQMSMDAAGMTMNANTDRLPRDCNAITERLEFKIHAGHRYAADLPGAMYGFSVNELEAPPCSLLTVTLVNDDEVRHQWMVHGLPRYLYPGGMFHLEAAAGRQRSGSFIVPSDARTYLVHCDMPQHMEKGMKAQLKVAGGNGNLWAVPHESDVLARDSYLEARHAWLPLAVFVGVLAIGTVLLRRA